MHFAVLNLRADEMPGSENVDYLRGGITTRIVLEPTSGLIRTQWMPSCCALVPPRIEYETRNVDYVPTRNHQTSFRVLNLDWLANAAMHTSEGVRFPGTALKYWGAYYPALTAFTGQTATTSIVSMESFPCAHCAYLRALEIVVTAEGLPAHCYATVLHLAPESSGELPTLHSSYSMFLGDDVGLCFSSSTTKLQFDASGCGNCGFPGHNRATCTRGERFYDKVGVEIEGRFLNTVDVASDARAAGASSCGDSSIRCGATPDYEPLEIQTKPGSVTDQLRQLARFYPDECDVSCGMHVHVSFRDPGSVTALATAEFMLYFQQRWEAWGIAQGLSPNSAFFSRLRGENDFCNINDENDLFNPYQADRYMQLNFLAWDEHRTVECRLLPMFRNAKHAYSAVVELLNIYEDWLGWAGPATLAEQKLMARDTPVVIDPIRGELALDIAPYSGERISQAVPFELADMPSIPEGMVRVCTVPRDRANLDVMTASIERAA